MKYKHTGNGILPPVRGTSNEELSAACAEQMLYFSTAAMKTVMVEAKDISAEVYRMGKAETVQIQATMLPIASGQGKKWGIYECRYYDTERVNNGGWVTTIHLRG